MKPQYSILYGDPTRNDVSVCYFCGEAEHPWHNLLRGKTLHIIFNLSSKLIIFDKNVRLSIIPGTLAMWHRGEGARPHIGQLPSTTEGKSSSSEHEMVIVSIPYDWIEKTFGSQKSALHPSLQAVLERSTDSMELGKIRSMLINEINLAREMISPPVLKPALPYWYGAKVIEIMTLHLFINTDTHNNTAFCNQIKSTNQRRITLAIDWLKNHLDQPLDLKALSEHLDCAPQYLSRLFSEQTGKTLTLTLRKLRIEKAAKLLSDGDYNVTEAAMEVGYNSLSHFSKAFLLEKGVKPSQFT